MNKLGTFGKSYSFKNYDSSDKSQRLRALNDFNATADKDGLEFAGKKLVKSLNESTINHNKNRSDEQKIKIIDDLIGLLNSSDHGNIKDKIDELEKCRQIIKSSLLLRTQNKSEMLNSHQKGKVENYPNSRKESLLKLQDEFLEVNEAECPRLSKGDYSLPQNKNIKGVAERFLILGDKEKNELKIYLNEILDVHKNPETGMAKTLLKRDGKTIPETKLLDSVLKFGKYESTKKSEEKLKYLCKRLNQNIQSEKTISLLDTEFENIDSTKFIPPTINPNSIDVRNYLDRGPTKNDQLNIERLKKFLPTNKALSASKIEDDIIIQYEDLKICLVPGGAQKDSLEAQLKELTKQTLNSKDFIIINCAAFIQEQNLLQRKFGMSHALVAVVYQGEFFIIDPKRNLSSVLNKKALESNATYVYANIQGSANTDCVRYCAFIKLFLIQSILENHTLIEASGIHQLSESIEMVRQFKQKRNIGNYLLGF